MYFLDKKFSCYPSQEASSQKEKALAEVSAIQAPSKEAIRRQHQSPERTVPERPPSQFIDIPEEEMDIDQMDNAADEISNLYITPAKDEQSQPAPYQSERQSRARSRISFSPTAPDATPPSKRQSRDQSSSQQQIRRLSLEVGSTQVPNIRTNIGDAGGLGDCFFKYNIYLKIVIPIIYIY